MCTLSFLPQNDGYLVAMNRDELNSRVVAAPPAIHRFAQGSALYPQEPSGGTWIGANSHGNLLAIMNANALNDDSQLPTKLKSRGEIIPLLLQEATIDSTKHALSILSLNGTHPFRLFGTFPRNRELRQWYWDGIRLSSRSHDWIRNHWFSSSRSDSRAEAQRGKAFEMSWRENLPDPAEWLHSLHASHIPDAGAFSVCVHREDAATVSYTEVRCSPNELRMTYQPGNPCELQGVPSTLALSLNANA
jgi:Transport and Golgi organisation 2